MPFESALTTILRGLKDPFLLFGLGAGIVLVGALTLTQSVPLVLIVSGVLVAALLGRLAGNVQAQRGGGIFTSVFSAGSTIRGSRISNVDVRSGRQARSKGRFFGSQIEDSDIGNVGPEPRTRQQGGSHGGDRPSQP